MFEKETFEYILKRVLNRVKNDVDKRQGSIIYDALAPACAELTQMYIALNTVMKITFAETSFGEWLDKRCAEMGVHREPATYASRLGVMKRSDGQPFDIPEGSRFSIETVNYTAYELVEPGVYVMKCEELGRLGNKFFGRLIPIETISGLASAELTDVLVPGEDIESDGSLFFRYTDKYDYVPLPQNYALSRTIYLNTMLSRSSNVTITFDRSRVYATQEDLNNLRIELLSIDLTETSATEVPQKAFL